MTVKELHDLLTTLIERDGGDREICHIDLNGYATPLRRPHIGEAFRYGLDGEPDTADPVHIFAFSEDKHDESYELSDATPLHA